MLGGVGWSRKTNKNFVVQGVIAIFAAIEGTKSLLFLCTTAMIQKQTIEQIAQEHLQGTEFSLVEVTVSDENDIEVIITREGGGVSIDDCVALSRFIESKLDRDKEDFSLMVGSAGI